MKRIVLLIMLCACWVDDDIVMAQCVVNSGTPTYSDGTYLSAAVCDANGAVKTSGGGGGTQYGEDTAHVSGDSVTMAGVVQQSADAALAGDGDRAVLQVDANGYLKVNVKAGAGGGVSVTEDAAHANGESVVPIACRRIDTAATSVTTSGDWATVDCDANGALRVRIDSSAVGGVSNDDDNSVAYSDTNHTTVLNIPYVANGTTWERQRKFVYLEDDAHANQDTGAVILSRRIDTAASSAGASADYATVNTDANGLLWTRNMDPCSALAKTHIAINISTATTTELTPSLAGASTYYYVCSIDLVTAGANNVALVDDDTDGCGSPTAGLAGGTTAATGWNFAANGGLTKGNGTGTVFKAVTANSVLCLVTSAAVQLSGSIQVVAAP